MKRLLILFTLLLVSLELSAGSVKNRLFDNLQIYSDLQDARNCDFLTEVSAPDIDRLKAAAIYYWANTLVIESVEDGSFATGRSYSCKDRPSVEKIVMEEKKNGHDVDLNLNLGFSPILTGGLHDLDETAFAGSMAARYFFSEKFGLLAEYSEIGLDDLPVGPLNSGVGYDSGHLDIDNISLGVAYRRPLSLRTSFLYGISVGLAVFESSESVTGDALVLSHGGEFRWEIGQLRPYYSLSSTIFFNLRISQTYYPNASIAGVDADGTATAILFGGGMTLWPGFPLSHNPILKNRRTPNIQSVNELEAESESESEKSTDKGEDDLELDLPGDAPMRQSSRKITLSVRSGFAVYGDGKISDSEFVEHKSFRSPVFLVGGYLTLPLAIEPLALILGGEIGYKRSLDKVEVSAAKIVSEGIYGRFYGAFEFRGNSRFSVLGGLGLARPKLETRVSSSIAIGKDKDEYRKDVFLLLGVKCRLNEKFSMGLDYSLGTSDLLGGVFYDF